VANDEGELKEWRREKRDRILTKTKLEEKKEKLSGAFERRRDKFRGERNTH